MVPVVFELLRRKNMEISLDYENLAKVQEVPSKSWFKSLRTGLVDM